MDGVPVWTRMKCIAGRQKRWQKIEIRHELWWLRWQKSTGQWTQMKEMKYGARQAYAQIHSLSLPHSHTWFSLTLDNENVISKSAICIGRTMLLHIRLTRFTAWHNTNKIINSHNWPFNFMKRAMSLSSCHKYYVERPLGRSCRIYLWFENNETLLMVTMW